MVAAHLIGKNASVNKAIIGAGDTVDGEVSNSVLGSGVIVEEGAIVRDSIIMKGTVIKKGAFIEKAIIAENCTIGEGAKLGVGEEAESKLNASVYAFGLAVVGENSVIPPNVTIGKNTAIRGITEMDDYPDGVLESGGYIIKAGEEE